MMCLGQSSGPFVLLLWSERCRHWHFFHLRSVSTREEAGSHWRVVALDPWLNLSTCHLDIDLRTAYKAFLRLTSKRFAKLQSFKSLQILHNENDPQEESGECS